MTRGTRTDVPKLSARDSALVAARARVADEREVLDACLNREREAADRVAAVLAVLDELPLFASDEKEPLAAAVVAGARAWCSARNGCQHAEIDLREAQELVRAASSRKSKARHRNPADVAPQGGALTPTRPRGKLSHGRKRAGKRGAARSRGRRSRR